MQKAFTTEPMHPIIDDHTQLDRSLDPSVNIELAGEHELAYKLRFLADKTRCDAPDEPPVSPMSHECL